MIDVAESRIVKKDFLHRFIKESVQGKRFVYFSSQLLVDHKVVFPNNHQCRNYSALVSGVACFFVVTVYFFLIYLTLSWNYQIQKWLGVSWAIINHDTMIILSEIALQVNFPSENDSYLTLTCQSLWSARKQKQITYKKQLLLTHLHSICYRILYTNFCPLQFTCTIYSAYVTGK